MLKQGKVIAAALFCFFFWTVFFIPGLKMDSVHAAATLVAEYDMQDIGSTIHDTSGNGNDGTVVSGSANPYGIFRKPIFNGITNSERFCRSFEPSKVGDDNPQYIQMSSSLATQINDAFTFETWVYCPAGADPGTTLLTSYSNKMRIWLYWSAPRSRVYMSRDFDISGTSTTITWKTSNPCVESGTWSHLVIAYDSTNSANTNLPKIYINGVSQTATYDDTKRPGGGTAKSFASETLHIGNRLWNLKWDRCFGGRMGTTRLYSGADAATVKDHYTTEKVNYPSQREVHLYGSSGKEVVNADKNIVPTTMNKIDIDLRPPTSVTQGTGFDKVSQATLQNNISLVNVDTAKPVSYIGTYNNTNGLYTMNAFGTLDSNTNYKVVINGDNITTTTGTVIMSGIQENNFKTFSVTPVLKLLNQAGTEIRTAADLANATQVSGNVVVGNASGTTQSAIAILAVYQGDTLVNLITKSPSTNPIPNETAADFSTDFLNLPSGQRTVKLFVWDDMQQMQPLAMNVLSY